METEADGGVAGRSMRGMRTVPGGTVALTVGRSVARSMEATAIGRNFSEVILDQRYREEDVN